MSLVRLALAVELQRRFGGRVRIRSQTLYQRPPGPADSQEPLQANLKGLGLIGGQALAAVAWLISAPMPKVSLWGAWGA